MDRRTTLKCPGASQNVTGSACQVRHDGRNGLIDCGLYQESGLRKRSWDPFPLAPETIDAPEDAGTRLPGIAVPCRDKLMEWLAVLCVAAIPYQLVRHHGEWTIHVAPHDASEAQRLLDEHEQQHRGWPPPSQAAVPETSSADIFSELWAAFWGVHVVGLFYLWLGPYRSSVALLEAAAGRRSAVRAGQWWRTVTALMIHADIGHLVSNLLFLALFAALISRFFGVGLGWLLILAAGAAGNALVAWTAGRDGIGIGASTACFGALGLLAAHGVATHLRSAAPWRDLWRKAWIPLGGGLAMLSMTGAAPGTDIAAHFFGFLAGIALGLPAAARAAQPPGARIQYACLALTIVIVATSWMMAWRFA